MDIQFFLMMVAGHYLADFPLQTEFMASTKTRIFIEPAGFHALTAHAFTHGLVIGLLSHNFTFAVVVGTTHWIIDFVRSSEWLISKLSSTKPVQFNIHLDQVLHISVIALCAYFLV